jgi:hypothetical protein
MTNLVVSSLCNLSCPFCFAEEHFRAGGRRGPAQFISESAFTERLELLQCSGMQEVRLVGGEPTLHPHFPQLVEQVRARGMRLKIFTHGLLKETVIACLENLNEQECTILINLSATEGLNSKVKERQRLALKRLGPRATPGLTISSPNFSLEPSMALILETGCRKAIRLGLAQPTLSGENRFLHPSQYSIVGSKIAAYAQIAASHAIRLEFDCGFVRCMFSAEALRILEQTRTSFGWHCSPIPDIDLEGNAIPCFPLAGRFSISLTLQSRPADLRSQLMQHMQPYRLAGIYPSCSSCDYKANAQCSGGCLAATIRRFRPATLSLSVPPMQVV